MFDADCTLSSPLSLASKEAEPLLCLSIVWHPDQHAIGAQYLTDIRTAKLELSRYAPGFQHPHQEGAPLGQRAISRTPLEIVSHDSGVRIVMPDSRMQVLLNGFPIDREATLSAAQVAAGAILALGGSVLLCLHWMHCLPKPNTIPGLVGVGDSTIRTRDLIMRVAPTDTAVLLLGETGSGKEVAAHAIHALSRRAARPMVAVNVAALSEGLATADLFGAAKGAYTGAHAGRNGLFAQAQESTLFLDEIGNTPAGVQPMLLRVLETGEYRPLGASQDLRADARMIAATDQDLYQAGFNQALLRRLESFVIPIAPLRQRREDIGLLVLHLMRERGNDAVLPFALMAEFALYDWPGNVRQLKHALNRAVLALQAGETPSLAQLVETPLATGTLKQPAAAPAPIDAASRKRLSDVSDSEVLEAMAANRWNIQAAARTLGISRPSMYKLIEAHGSIRRPEQIDVEELRRAVSQCGADLTACADLLRTPAESLRRHLAMLEIVV